MSLTTYTMVPYRGRAALTHLASVDVEWWSICTTGKGIRLKNESVISFKTTKQGAPLPIDVALFDEPREVSWCR